jgi:ribosomal protein L16 Arg81 hydroxylase
LLRVTHRRCRPRGAVSRADREETYEAGDAYYVPPGHTPVHYAGAEIVEFTPTDVLAQTIPVVMDNLHARSQG